MYMTKLRPVRGMLGEFWAHIAIVGSGRWNWNHFINTKFTKHTMEIADSIHEHMTQASSKKFKLDSSFFLNHYESNPFFPELSRSSRTTFVG